MKAVEINFNQIALRDELMPRTGIDDDVVDDYAQCLEDLPPILVAIDKPLDGLENLAAIQNGFDKIYVVIDGWHRYYAHRQTGNELIMAIIDKKLKPEDFFFTAVKSNKTHGLRFSAEEKKRIAKHLFMKENRSAAEISEAVGCSMRHASDLIQELAHEKKAQAIKYAKQQAKDYSVREIAEQLTKMGFKASKSSVSRWIQPESTSMDDHLTIKEESQIGEVPEEDRWEKVEEEPVDRPVMNVSGEVATVAPMLYPSKATITGSRVGVCLGCNTRTVRIPDLSPGMSAVCTELFFHCDKCEEYVSIRTLLPKADDEN